jgi:hypothetical protein
MQAETKGVAFVTALPILQRTFGEDAFRSVLAQMPLEFQQTHARGEITALGWYPLAWLNAYHAALQATCGPQASLQMGELTCRADINVFFRFAMRFVSPETLITRAMGSISKSYSRGFSLVSLNLSQSRCAFQAQWSEDVHAGCWDDLLATCHVFLEMAKAKRIVANVKQRDARRMDFEFSWEP